MRHERTFALKLMFGLVIVTALVALFLLFYIVEKRAAKSPEVQYLIRKKAREAQAYKDLNLALVDPAEAPHSIRFLAERGFRAMLETGKYAPEYVGDKLNCTSCHFAGGNTTGGSQGGISLVGVAAKYPSFDQSLGSVITLQTRINNCFTRSMNGKAIPVDGDLMLALVTYMQWISKGVPIYGEMPWLGLKPLEQKRAADLAKGAHLYDTYCALCHKSDGQGGEFIPPLWGEDSFNSKAGLHRIGMLATFIFWNMPYNEMTPTLTEEEAFDIAAYVLSQPRP